MVNLAAFVASELRAMMIKDVQLYQSGNMKSNVQIAAVNDDYIDIVIATDYASYTNTRGRMAGWVERTVERCCRCYADNNDVASTSEEAKGYLQNYISGMNNE